MARLLTVSVAPASRAAEMRHSTACTVEPPEHDDVSFGIPRWRSTRGLAAMRGSHRRMIPRVRSSPLNVEVDAEGDNSFRHAQQSPLYAAFLLMGRDVVHRQDDGHTRARNLASSTADKTLLTIVFGRPAAGIAGGATARGIRPDGRTAQRARTAVRRRSARQR